MPYKTRKIVLHEMCVKLVEEKNSKHIDLFLPLWQNSVASKKLHHFLDFRSCCAYEHVHVQHEYKQTRGEGGLDTFSIDINTYILFRYTYLNISYYANIGTINESIIV